MVRIPCLIYFSVCRIANAAWKIDESAQPRKFLIDIDATLQSLLEREDTDKNMQITIEDVGPKV